NNTTPSQQLEPMGQFGVGEAKETALREKMQMLGIREEDLEEKFICSQGRGGQHVNKTSTCVYLRHIPTGIEVKCQRERSQPVNRYLARRILAEKIEQLLFGKESSKQQRIEKIRRQKQKRAQRARKKLRTAHLERQAGSQEEIDLPAENS
ncbi:MAG: peptide chain release factor-like protein, partial [Candidatus Sumerlaeaceae bacterium]|nr:peptide chain release factor-like protein [Candidatus Sumerlaeaceae bacterium]